MFLVAGIVSTYPSSAQVGVVGGYITASTVTCTTAEVIYTFIYLFFYLFIISILFLFYILENQPQDR